MLAGCAGAPAPLPPGSGTVISSGAIELAGRDYRAHWYLPERSPLALVVIEHGFTRFCSHVRGTTLAFASAGFAALCIDAPMGNGNLALDDALARSLMDGRLPDGRALPGRIIVAGHSAGAAFALELGARLDAFAPERLAGALLFDPVATDRFEAGLRAVSAGGRRPVLAVLAPPHRCNANGNAASALNALGRDTTAFVGVRLGPQASHLDAEGEDSDRLAVAACGAPQAANTALLRRLAVRWALDITAGTAPAPPPGVDRID